MDKQLYIDEKNGLREWYLNTPTRPNKEQAQALLALNKRMFSLLIDCIEFFFNARLSLDQRIENKNDPLSDHWAELEVIFYHKDTDQIIAVSEMRAWDKDTVLHQISDFNFLYPMRFMDNSPISEWMGRLIDAYNLSWYELLNIGDIKIRLKTDYDYIEYINDTPEEEQ